VESPGRRAAELEAVGQLAQSIRMQKSFFGVPSIREAKYLVYHDESGTDRRHDRFLLQGALFVPEERWQHALDLLAKARGGYPGRIHFVDLRDKTTSLKGLAAWAWMDLFFASLSDFCPFKCMIADTASTLPHMTRFSKPHHLYNYTAMLAIRGGIVWSLKHLQRIHLSIYSEKASRTAEDNFVSYVPREVARRANLRRAGSARAPEVVEPIANVCLVEGDPANADPSAAGHCEFIQLADLLTSAVSQAVNASSAQAIKIDLGRFIAGWIGDTRLPPWTQALDLHRRFSVSCFPDAKGAFYDLPLAIVQRGQMPLYDG